MDKNTTLSQAIDPRYLININFGTLQYPSAENAYQASRQPVWKQQQFQTMTPEHASYRGSFIHTTNMQKELDSMYQIQKEKFSQEPLRGILVSTGDAPIVFYNTRHDNFWGVCTCRLCNGHGQNRLGKILEQIRSEQ